MCIMRSKYYEIKQNSFKLRYTGDGPAFSYRCIGLNNITPDITLSGIWGFLFSILTQVFDAGPFWTAKLGHQKKTEQKSHRNTFIPFLAGLSFLWLKIWSNFSRSWKHYRTGLAKPSKNCRAGGPSIPS